MNGASLLRGEREKAEQSAFFSRSERIASLMTCGFKLFSLDISSAPSQGVEKLPPPPAAESPARLGRAVPILIFAESSIALFSLAAPRTCS